jgi:pimeloyl-ACP methyl ester carboxylesterase
MRERAVRFGEGSGIVGILSSAAQPGHDAPGILLLNAGILHRVGACRLHVRLARRLAAEGFPVLRFDFSGIGDSEVRRDGLSFEESSVVETREAMDLMTSKVSASRFVAIGLCSGADAAVEAASADERIVGLGLLDPWVYRTPRYYLRRFGPKLFRPSAWAHSIRVRVRPGPDATGLPSLEEAEEGDIELPTYVRVFPPRRETEERFRKFVSRDLEICAVLTGGQPGHYNYEGQFRQCFRRANLGERLVEIYRPAADHIFTDLAEQEGLIETLVSWASERWGVAEPEAVDRLAG